MIEELAYHPLVQKDFTEILAYYESEAGEEVADRFEMEFREAITAIKKRPKHSHFT